MGKKGVSAEGSCCLQESAQEECFQVICGTSHRCRNGFDGGLSSAEPQVMDVLRKCNMPVIKVNGHEADNVVAMLPDQVLQKGFRVVLGYPEKDFNHLICEDVQMVMPRLSLVVGLLHIKALPCPV